MAVSLRNGDQIQHATGVKSSSNNNLLAHVVSKSKLGMPEDHCETFAVIDPATNKVIAHLPDAGEEQCLQAIDAAVRAQAKLGDLTGKERGQILRRWHDLIMDYADELASIITAENGKPIAEAKGEVIYAASFVDWFAGAAPRIEGSVFSSSNRQHRIITIKQAVGVCSMITPWNFPSAMITRKVAAALSAGCACVVKPAAETPLTALALAELASRAGLPSGSLTILPTLRNTVAIGKLLTLHPSIRKFSFTGSTAVGKLLSAQCASTVKKVSLELGGNAPFIVFNDADIEAAISGLMTSKFRLSGQTCVCANRVFVQAGIYAAFVARVVKEVETFKLGPGSEPSTTHGPLITPRAAEKVAKHVDDAVAKGAAVKVGGTFAKDLGPSFFQPTVLADVSIDSLCASEETFGPLLPIFRFLDEEEVIALANKTEVGLAAYFFTKDSSRAWKVAEALNVGMVGVNTGLISDVASPFGGVKESGMGREGSVVGTEEYLEIKSITFNLT